MSTAQFHIDSWSDRRRSWSPVVGSSARVGWLSTGGQRRRDSRECPRARTLPFRSFEHARASHGFASLNKEGETSWKVLKSPPPRPFSTTAASAPAPSASRPAASRSRLRAQSPRTSTAETMLLSATSAGKHPREGFDFFPLTVDVEERSYAAGKIPGSFFRREGRPSTEAILVWPSDRPPAAPVVRRRNCATRSRSSSPSCRSHRASSTTRSRSTRLPRRPRSRVCRSPAPSPVVRLAFIPGQGEHADQWVAFPNAEQVSEAVFDLIVAGRVVTKADGSEDVAIMNGRG